MHNSKKKSAFINRILPSYLYRLLYGYLPLLTIIGIFIVVLVTSTCAQIQPLEGGPVDSVPPKLISTNPIHESTGFKGRKLQLTFDKEVQVQDIYNRLVVTPKLPRLENAPSYICKARGNRIDLDLEAPLEENTTYTFNFKDAIRDTKEGTAAENPTLTFSTGDFVDSLYIIGQVRYLMTDQPVKDALVAIYKLVDSDTSHILNTTPDYFTKTNENGEFKLEHIKEGKYRVCAGYSKENKLILDPAKEPYGFLQMPLELSAPIDSLAVYIVEANVNEFKVQSSQPQSQYFEINFSKPVTTYTLTLAQQSKRFKDVHLYSHLIEDGLTIRVYNTLGLLPDDMLGARLTAQDAMENKIEQDITIHFRDRVSEKEAFKYKIKPAAGAKLDPKLVKVALEFSKPVRNIELDNLFFMVGTTKLKLTPEEVVLHAHRDNITIQKKFELADWIDSTENDSTKVPDISLHIAKGAFVSVEKESNEPGEYKYMFKHSQECGIIKGRIITKLPGFIVQLLNEQYEVLEEIRNQRDYEFKEVLPGNYRIRVLGLKRKDGQWRFGNINETESPDPVVFYPHELPLVANWEFDYIDVRI